MSSPLFSLTPGVRCVLVIWACLYLVSLAGELSGTFALQPALALTPSEIASGQVWRLFTHALAPAGVFDLIMGGLVLAWIGSRVEGAWSRREFLGYCGLCAIGAGVIPTLVMYGNNGGMLGTTAPAVGMLVAWARLYGHEWWHFTAQWRFRVRSLVATFLALILLLNLFTGGLFPAVYLLSAALTGWAYLSWTWRRQRNQPARPIESGRINRLEL